MITEPESEESSTGVFAGLSREELEAQLVEAKAAMIAMTKENCKCNLEYQKTLQFLGDLRHELAGHEHNDPVIKQLEADVDLYLLERW